MRHAEQPQHCPLCGSRTISIAYDNDGNGSYSEWYTIECLYCGAHGTVAVKKNGV